MPQNRSAKALHQPLQAKLRNGRLTGTSNALITSLLIAILLIVTPAVLWRLWHPYAALATTVFLGFILLAASLYEAKQKNAWQNALLQRFMPKAVLEQWKPGSPAPSGGGRQDITVMVVDIRGFTALTEHLPPAAMTELLNDFYSTILQTVSPHQGMVNKLLGDGALVLFGVTEPESSRRHADQALQAAIALKKELLELSQRWQKNRQLSFHTGISVHSGLAFVGFIGPKTLIEFTAIGDTVNLAVGLQQINKQLGRPLLVTTETISRLINPYPELSPLSSMTIKDRDLPVTLYTL
ncbi:MAG: adenylate/guanylate cyclase domain-containing protein [Vampirovibrionales bacterium]|nr:adenylate/guanylate cyclase domain-containing protein [Vampirovibrionales bacterium]